MLNIKLALKLGSLELTFEASVGLTFVVMLVKTLLGA